MRRPSRHAAFTLLELIVALGVFTFVMIGVIACWRCIANGVVTGERAAAECQRARIGIKTIEDGLSVAEISSQNARFYSFLTDTSERFAKVSFAGRMPSSFPGSGYYGDSVMRRVTFDVEQGQDGTNNLILTQSPLLAVGFEKTSPYQIVLARDVSLFTLEFWSIKESDWEQTWDETNRMPPLIRVTLGVGHVTSEPDTPFALVTREVAPTAVAH